MKTTPTEEIELRYLTLEEAALKQPGMRVKFNPKKEFIDSERILSDRDPSHDDYIKYLETHGVIKGGVYTLSKIIPVGDDEFIERVSGCKPKILKNEIDPDPLRNIPNIGFKLEEPEIIISYRHFCEPQ